MEARGRKCLECLPVYRTSDKVASFWAEMETATQLGLLSRKVYRKKTHAIHQNVTIPYFFHVQVCGYRMRLHFDGYSECHDFWLNANSPNIHPAGWFEKTGHKLQPPKGRWIGTLWWLVELKKSLLQEIAGADNMQKPGHIPPETTTFVSFCVRHQSRRIPGRETSVSWPRSACQRQTLQSGRHCSWTQR